MVVSKKTYHEQEKKMAMKIGKAGGGTGAVVFLGVATLAAAAAAAAAIASALVVRRKGRKSGKNHHSHQEVEQSLQTEFPETLNKENDQDNLSKEREFILPNTPLSVKNHQWYCNGTADMDVIKDDSASLLFTGNLKLDEKPMLEINGGTGGPAYKEKEVCCSDNTNNLESTVNTEGSVTVVNEEEFHLLTFDDKLLLEHESKDKKQNPEVEIELTMDDDAIGGVHSNKIVAESNQEVQENNEWKKNAVEMQFSEEDETKNCLDQEIIIGTCGSMPGNIVTENYGEGGQELVPPVFNSRLINDHENTNSNEKESSLLIATVEKIEVNAAIETAEVGDSIHKSKMHLVKQESDYSDAVIVQDYEQEISCNDDKQNVENSQFEEYVKDVQTLSFPTELPETLNEENGQDNAGKEIQFILPHPCTGTADTDVEADSASSVFANNLKLNEKPIADGSVTVIKEEFHLPTFDDKLPLEPELKDEMQNREEEIGLTKDDDTIEGVPIDKIMPENNQEMQENIEAKKNAVEMQFSEEEDKTKNFRDQDKIIGTRSSMPGIIATENYGEGGRELLLPLFDSRPIIDHENTNVYKEISLPIETVEKIEGNEAIETAQVDGIHKSNMQLVKQGCDCPDAEIVRDYEQISCHDDEQNAETSQYEDYVKDALTFSLPKELPANENGQDNASKEIQFILPRTHPSEKKNPCTGTADVDEIKAVSASFSFTEYLTLNEKPIADCSVTAIKEEFHLPTFDDKLLLEPESKNKMHKHEVEIELAKEDGAIDGAHIDKIMADDNQNMQENIEGKQNAVEMQFSEEKNKNRHDQEIDSTGSSMPGTTVLENYGEGGKELLSVFDSRPIIKHENVNSDDKEGSLPIEAVQKSERNEAIEMTEVDDGIHNAEVQLVEQEECNYPDAEIQDCEQKISRNDDEQNIENGQREDDAKHVQTFSFQILSYPSNIMAGIAIEKDSMNEQLSTEATGVDVTNVVTSATQEMKDNSTLELVVCQQKEFENAEKEIEEASETICAGIDTSEYDPIMQMSKNEEKGEDNDNDSDDSDEDDLPNTIEESSVGTRNFPLESNTECAEESLSELSIDGKGNSKMTCSVELAKTHNNQPTYSSRRRILIGVLSALSWFSFTWFFGLSFIKLGLIVLLTMILSKIHGY